MKLKKVVDLPTVTEAKKIYARLDAGTMTYYEDEYGYAMFDEDELKTYKPRKSGRKEAKQTLKSLLRVKYCF